MIEIFDLLQFHRLIRCLLGLIEDLISRHEEDCLTQKLGKTLPRTSSLRSACQHLVLIGIAHVLRSQVEKDHI